MPRIVTAKKPKPRKPGDPPIRRASGAAPSPGPTAPVDDDRKSALVTIRRKRAARADVPDMTPEEHKRRGDAADALFREMKRRIAVVRDRP